MRGRGEEGTKAQCTMRAAKSCSRGRHGAARRGSRVEGVRDKGERTREHWTRPGEEEGNEGCGGRRTRIGRRKGRRGRTGSEELKRD